MALKGIKSRQRSFGMVGLTNQRACIYDQFGLVLVIFQGVGDRKDTIGDDRLFLKCLIIHKNIRLSTIAYYLQLHKIVFGKFQSFWNLTVKDKMSHISLNFKIFIKLKSILWKWNSKFRILSHLTLQKGWTGFGGLPINQIKCVILF